MNFRGGEISSTNLIDARTFGKKSGAISVDIRPYSTNIIDLQLPSFQLQANIKPVALSALYN